MKTQRTDAVRGTNRLADETSPYLRQHAHNPVDWYPWGPEAFERARREDRPVFLSIGYSACHWCHVMERESFEDDAIAAILNENFVSIKVDREERPDVDDVYMAAVQLTVGRGGWPLSAFLLPDSRPFFGGTYFPPDDRGGRVGFRTLLLRLAEAYRTRRAELEETAQRIVEEVQDGNRVTRRLGHRPLAAESLGALTSTLKRSFDARHGGFGGAPKFPPHIALEWLLKRGAEGDETARSMSLLTLDAMALGGIHDHVGGGFHRYSTDAYWLVPHFEKMLTDNAQLLGLYARAFALTGRELYRRVAIGIGDYLLSEMRGPEGAFYAATDADSEGEEGKFFVWSFEELTLALGKEAGFFGKLYQARPAGNYEDESSGRTTGLNILHLQEEPTGEEERRLAPLRLLLRERRRLRVPPGLDDKRLAGWNALAVSGLAIAGRALGEPRYLAAARATARFLLETQRDANGRLLRSWKEGAGKIPAFLEDEAYLANALLDLAEADAEADSEWTRHARDVVFGLRARFRSEDVPGFTFTGEGHEALVAVGKDLFDKATPSASGSATRALVHLSRRTSDKDLAREARAILEEVSGLMARAPHGTETWYLAAAELLELERHVVTEGPAPVARPVASETSERETPSVVTALTNVTPSVSIGAGFEGFPEGDPSVSPGRELRVAVKVAVAEGFHLAGEDGLVVEAWGGRDLSVGGAEMPKPVLIQSEDGVVQVGYRGDLLVVVPVVVGVDAAPGERLLSLQVRYRACGDGACEPERVLGLALPFRIAPLAG